MAPAQLLQPWADECSNYRGVALKNQGSGQYPQELAVVRPESSEWREARVTLVRSDFAHAIDTHWRKRVLEWNRIVNSSGIPE